MICVNFFFFVISTIVQPLVFSYSDAKLEDKVSCLRTVALEFLSLSSVWQSFEAFHRYVHVWYTSTSTYLLGSISFDTCKYRNIYQRVLRSCNDNGSV